MTEEPRDSDQALNALVRDVLLDAAGLEFRQELADTAPVPVSRRFQREMTAMLTDPAGWVRRKTRPRWQRMARFAAAVFLTVSLSLGAVLAASPTARAAALRWVREIYDTYIVYRFSGRQDHGAMPLYALSALPEGYAEVPEERVDSAEYVERVYQNNDESLLRFICYRMQQGSAMVVDTENMVVSDITVNGCPGQLYLSQDPTVSSAVVWADQGAGIQFTIDGFFDGADLLHMAESVSLSDFTK